VQTNSKKEESQSVMTKELMSLDYPQEGETIAGPNYSFRISAPQDAPMVELCINQGPWQLCRQAIGFWWFDCSDLTRGLYQARARMHTNDGKVKLTLLRRFQVAQ